MLDHLNLPVGNLTRSTAFYEKVLAPIGMRVIAQEEDAVGFGDSTWVFGLVDDKVRPVPMHLAFAAATRNQVHAFYTEAINAGGVDNGAPGVRAEYGTHYYAAYVLDPDGHNIEVVCRQADSLDMAD